MAAAFGLPLPNPCQVCCTFSVSALKTGHFNPDAGQTVAIKTKQIRIALVGKYEVLEQKKNDDTEEMNETITTLIPEAQLQLG